MFSLHIFSLLLSFSAIAVADKQALAWLRGKVQTLNYKTLHAIHLIMWIGLVGLMATGFLMFYPMRVYLFTQPLFIIKLLFVGILVTNGILISRSLHVASKKSYTSLSFEEKVPLLVSGAISFFSWIGATILALVLFS